MIEQVIHFFIDIPLDSWRDIFLSSFIIPLVFYLFSALRKYFISARPLNQVLAGFRKSKEDILIFLSQLSSAQTQGTQLKLGQRQLYVARFPMPTPQNQANIAIRNYTNIDPVWSQSDGQCAAEIFNLLGQVKKHQGFRIANTIRDWNIYSKAIFTVGFNPKTVDLLSICNPVNFKLDETGNYLSITGHEYTLNSLYPLDAGVIQKTFLSSTGKPVFILAGLGTTGTEAAGKVLNENAIAFGKLYGSSSFCVLFQTDITRGGSFYKIKGIFPRPILYRALWYPKTFFHWYRKNVFPTKRSPTITT
jgi:hypothetical protein